MGEGEREAGGQRVTDFLSVVFLFKNAGGGYDKRLAAMQPQTHTHAHTQHSTCSILAASEDTTHHDET